MAKDYTLEKRKYVIGGFIAVIVLIFIIRLFNLQVSDGTYKENAESNAFFRKVLYLPAASFTTAMDVSSCSTSRNTT